MRNTKGTSLILEQIIIAMFGVILMVTVITAFGTLKGDISDFIAEESFEAAAANVHSAVVQAHNKMQYFDYGRIQLTLTPLIAGKPYTVYLNSTDVFIESIVGATNKSVDVLNLDAVLSGNVSSTAGGKNYVVFNKTANTISLETLF